MAVFPAIQLNQEQHEEDVSEDYVERLPRALFEIDLLRDCLDGKGNGRNWGASLLKVGDSWLLNVMVSCTPRRHTCSFSRNKKRAAVPKRR